MWNPLELERLANSVSGGSTPRGSLAQLGTGLPRLSKTLRRLGKLWTIMQLSLTPALSRWERGNSRQPFFPFYVKERP